jgi:hypothetical protein
MLTAIRTAVCAFAVLAVIAACTPRAPQMQLTPPTMSTVTVMDDTPPPCQTCDSDGGMPK